MPKHTDPQLLEACRLCVTYLSEKYPTEPGLFRSSVAQTDVRVLQTQIIETGYSKFRDDPDPHLVAEVLQTSLKNLALPLLHDVYQDIANTDLDDDDFELSEQSIQEWMVKLPEAKFELTSSLFRMLSQLAAVDESDSSLVQLAYSVSPTICRPTNSAYMSIRHMEDLRKIRPVVSFILENYEEVFTEDLKPVPVDQREVMEGAIGSTGSGKMKGVGNLMGSFATTLDKADDITSLMSTSMVIDNSNSSNSNNGEEELKASMDQGDASAGGAQSSAQAWMDSNSKSTASPIHATTATSLHNKPHNLLLAIPSSGDGSTGANVPALPSGGNESGTEPTANILQMYSDQELHILELLVRSSANHFLELESGSRPPTARDKASSSSVQDSPMATAAAAAAGRELNNTNSNSSSNIGGDDTVAKNNNNEKNVSMGVDSPTDKVSAASSTYKSNNSNNTLNNTALSQQSARTASGPENAAAVNTTTSSTLSTATAAMLTSDATMTSGGGGMSRKNRRRKMVADCKAMRVQIFEFEQDWTKKHNRIPKSFERGSMETVYTNYRKLKKQIRDAAATDLQRVYRGFAVRKRLRKQWSMAGKAHRLSAVAAAATVSDGNVTPSSSMEVVDSSHTSFFSAPAATAGTSGGSTGTGTNSSGTAPVNGSTIPTTLYASYRELLEKKRDLKRKLKKFDEDFIENWGRPPKKSDKEVIRPMYQMYHEIKAKLDEQRLMIEASHGPLPADLQDGDGGGGSGGGGGSVGGSISGNSSVASVGVQAGTGAAAAAGMKQHHPNGAGAPAGSASGDGKTAGFMFNVNNEAPVINVESELEAIMVEKRNLHAYLKVYERDFSRMHGRPVTKHADIQPVAHEYQRYKELKNLIKEKKAAVTGGSSGSSAGRKSANSASSGSSATSTSSSTAAAVLDDDDAGTGPGSPEGAVTVATTAAAASSTTSSTSPTVSTA
eukprot:CAMPEP_0174958510 /NCGR_PEP_ID=MMETSP0004_2-20121128/2664_1 /TAXON_ID=420556 /ORGANISM="Ochromonas sp., Strain CCMP1393" /LENGTH=952 /DNA_ID=CAMNT_0016206731 /DNA_START=63 /DNA_END=2920 /DNA_ORIENTATION=+